VGTTTSNLALYKPAIDETGWGALRNTSYDDIDTALGTQHNNAGAHKFITVTAGTGYIRFPSLTTVQRDALAASNGDTIYNTTTSTLQSYQAGSWQTVIESSITVEEIDLTPSVSGVSTIRFPNGTLTDVGGGIVSVTGFLQDAEGVISGDVLYFDGTNWSRIAPGIVGQRFITQGNGAAPVWETAEPIPAGTGTGQILYWDGSAWVTLAAGTAGYLLEANGANPPQWILPGSGGNVTAGAAIADNAVVRGDGGGVGVQASGVLVDDSDNVSGIVNLTTTGTVTFNGITYTYPVADAVGALTSDGAGNLTWSVAAGATVFADNVFRVQDDGDATKEIAFQASGITTGNVRTITMPDTDVDLGDIATNTAKVSNIDHTGEVTSSGAAATLESAAITNKGAATVASGDLVLVSDIDDSNNLKQVTAQSIGDLGGGGGGATLELAVVQAQTFSVGDWIYHNGTTYELADASAAATAESIGIVSARPDASNFTVQFGGRITGLSGLTAGEAHFLSETAGAITATAPTATDAVVKPVLIADSTTSGFIFNMRGVSVTTTESFFQSFTSASLSAGVLTVTHNLGNKFATVQVYNDSDQMVVPDQITLSDANELTVDLSSFTVNNTWTVVVLDSGSSIANSNISASTTFTSAGVTSFNHNLGTTNVIVQVYDNNGDMVQPDDITVVSAAQVDVDTTSFTVTGTWSIVVLSAGAAVPSASLQSAFDNGQSITIAAGDNQTLLIDNDDTTNNPVTIDVDNAGTGTALNIDQAGNCVNAFKLNNAGTGIGISVDQQAVSASDREGLRIYSNAAQINSQLARIWLDNASSTTDALIITNDGSGKALSMNAPMTNTGQIAFSTFINGGTQNNIATGSAVTILFSGEVFDVGGNFASNTFTAPITGKYQLNVMLNFSGGMDTAASSYTLRIVTSNRTYHKFIDYAERSSDPAREEMTMAVLADLDASDTAHVAVVQTGGTAQTDIDTSYFTGHLVA
jgi:hypothetical protein